VHGIILKCFGDAADHGDADGSPDEQGTAFQKGFGGMFVRPGGVLVDNFTEDKRI
ncbi:MAG: hypothetical protein RL222_563, partial [Bacteroidota bacterium]